MENEINEMKKEAPAAESPTEKKPPKKEGQGPKKKRPKLPPAKPITEPSLPLLLCAVSLVLSLLTLIADRFIHPFAGELLSPVIMQIIILLIPAYIVALLLNPQKKPLAVFSDLGFGKIKATNAFFVIFTALFASAASLALTLLLGGAYNASEGMTLLGTFTAGKNEFTYSYPYLIFTYVLLPAVIEEIFFRGVLFKQLGKISFPYAAICSATLCAFFSFSLGGFIPALFFGLVMAFVMYTTGSLFSCIAVHLLFNLYRLFIESNVSEYYLSGAGNALLLVTVFFVLLVSSLLFVSECIRIYRKKAADVADGKARPSTRLERFKTLRDDLRSTFAYKPSIVLISICGAAFLAVVIINVLS